MNRNNVKLSTCNIEMIKILSVDLTSKYIFLYLEINMHSQLTDEK